MLISSPSNPAETGPQGVELAAQAEKMEALLWEQVVTCMTKTALPEASLGAGSSILNGIAIHAMADSMFGPTESSLTHEIVGDLQQQIAGRASSAAEARAPTLSSLSQLERGAGAATGGMAHAVAFAKSVWPSIKAQAASLGVPPVALLAQSALETGWGASTPDHNLFGIKAIGGQSATLQNTREEVDGTLRATRASFASYRSGADCMSHYASLIRRAYPDAVGAPSVAQYADALVKGGYATDSAYAQKIVDLAQSPTMRNVLNAIEGNS